ncbi:MAG: hypothetical protein R6U35_01985 [Candidatus Humimicrobiaceae bacterium]
MKKGLVFGIIFLFGIFLFASPLYAFTSKGGETVNISEEVSDDLYAFGNTVNLLNDIAGDFVAAGARVNASGNVGGDLIASGGMLEITGDVGDDARIAGGIININSSIQDDLIVAGGQVTIGSEANIGGDLVITGGTVSISGQVADKVIGSGGNITISATVGKDVRIDDVSSLNITSSADIGGDLSYSSSSEASISEDASIAGDVNFNLVTEKQKETKIAKASPFSIFAATYFGGKIISFISLFVLGILLLLAIPKAFDKFNQKLENTLGNSVGAGAIMVFGVPIAAVVLFIISIILFVTIIGSGVGVVLLTSDAILLVLYGLLLYVSGIFLSYLLGKTILAKSTLDLSKYGWKVLAYLIGLVIIMIAYSIPFIGWLARLVGMLFGFGGLVLIIKDWLLASYRER